MKTIRLVVTVVLAACLAWVVCCGDSAEEADSPAKPVVEIPKLDGIVIDGDVSDWVDGGFRVSWLTQARFSEGLAGPDEFDPTFRLGWTDDGLLVQVVVSDDSFTPAADDELLWANRADVLVLYVIPERGGEEFTRIAVAPNHSGVVNNVVAGPPEPRVLVSVDAVTTDREERPSPYRAVDPAGEGPDVRLAREGRKGGYALEMLIPFSVVGLSGRMGDEFGMQVGLVDSDPLEGDELEQGAAMWFPQLGTSSDTSLSYLVRLSDQAGDPVLCSVTSSEYRSLADFGVVIEGGSEMAGKSAEVRVGDKTLATGDFKPGESGWQFVELRCEAPAWDRAFDEVDVFADGRQLPSVTLPPAQRRCADILVHGELEFDGFSFTDERFPRCTLEDAEAIEGILGPYELNVTYYDADYKVVAAAEQPGRYGAVVEIVPETGRPLKRFCTLFRTAGDLGWREWNREMRVDVTLPDALGITPEAMAAYPDTVEDFARWRVVDGLFEREEGAVLLAGLYEASGDEDEDDFYTNPHQRDRAWWLGLKRKLYGWDERWPEPVVCPVTFEGAPATVVHDGTLEEAGMKPDTVDKIDAILTEWAADTDEAFAVCIVRRGVIVLHKAYGTRDDEPMTVTTKSWMASTTKMLSGSLVMMLVDQGLMDLDDPIQDYLPALADIETNEPLTIRRLYNHSDDFDWHFGHDVNDMEERIIPLVGLLNVGGQYRYNGTGMELTCKALEAISGETLPEFFKNHLLDPLGCENTDVGSASHDARSVPLDMARISQMLLNKGAYGNMRFMREETFEQMLPRQVELVEGETSTEYGVGTTWVRIPGLSEASFCHGAASAATTWIDPVNELIICMTRDDAGKNFYNYHMPFIEAVVEGMIDPRQQYDPSAE